MKRATRRWMSSTIVPGFSALAALTTAGCGGPDSSLPVDVAVVVQGAGSVAHDAPGGRILPGNAVVLTAIPEPKWRFDHWEGDFSSTQNPLTVIPTADMNLTSVFVRVSEVTATAAGGGAVIMEPDDGIVDTGALVKLTAEPDEGWRFDHWSGLEVDRTAASILVEVKDDLDVVAYFVRWYSVQTSVEGEGIVRPDSGQFDEVTRVSFSAEASEGWRFDHWEGDAAGADLTVEVTIGQDLFVKAVFVRNADARSIAGSWTVSHEPLSDTCSDYDIADNLPASSAWVIEDRDGSLFASDEFGESALAAFDAETGELTFVISYLSYEYCPDDGQANFWTDSHVWTFRDADLPRITISRELGGTLCLPCDQLYEGTAQRQ